MLYEVLRHVRPLVLNSARVVEAALRDDNLTVGMRAVLEVLADQGPLTVPMIGDHLDLARQGIQRHVNDLIDRSLVQARSNPAHRRSALIATTPAGTALFTRIREDELARLGTMAGECSAEEIATAIRVMAALDRDVRAAARGETGGPGTARHETDQPDTARHETDGPGRARGDSGAPGKARRDGAPE